VEPWRGNGESGAGGLAVVELVKKKLTQLNKLLVPYYGSEEIKIHIFLMPVNCEIWRFGCVYN